MTPPTRPLVFFCSSRRFLYRDHRSAFIIIRSFFLYVIPSLSNPFFFGYIYPLSTFVTLFGGISRQGKGEVNLPLGDRTNKREKKRKKKRKKGRLEHLKKEGWCTRPDTLGRRTNANKGLRKERANNLSTKEPRHRNILDQRDLVRGQVI